MTDLSPRTSLSGVALQVQRMTDEAVVELRLRGELDLASAAELERELARACNGSRKRILIDLSGLEFMDSTGLALIIRTELDARANGHQLRLRCGSPQIQRLFDLAGILDRFTFED